MGYVVVRGLLFCVALYLGAIVWCGHPNVIWLWVVAGVVGSHADVVVLWGSGRVDKVGRGKVSVRLTTTVTAPVVKLVVGEVIALSDGVRDYFVKYVDEGWHVVVCVTSELAVGVRWVRVGMVAERVVWRVGVVAEEVLRSSEGLQLVRVPFGVDMVEQS